MNFICNAFARTSLILSIVVLCLKSSTAQQIVQQGLYMLDPYSINPAYGGLNNGLTLTGNFRKQWSSLDGSPVSQYVSAHMPLKSINSGAGVVFRHDALGASNIIDGSFSYNYILPTTFFLSVGGGIGLSSKRLDGSILKTPDGNYENGIDHQDPNIPDGKISSNNGLINLGVLLRLNTLELGISSIQSVGFKLNNAEFYQYRPYHHLTMYASYFYSIDEDWKIVPNALFKYDFNVMQTDLDIHIYNNNLFGGIGARGYNTNSFDAIKLIIGGRISEKLMVSYNFESPISSINTYSGSTHELLLQYRIPTNLIQRTKEKMIYHPRM